MTCEIDLRTVVHCKPDYLCACEILTINSGMVHWFINLLTITANYLLYFQHTLTRKCTLWRCKSTPTPKAKLLWMTSHYGPTVVRSVTEIPFHVFI